MVTVGELLRQQRLKLKLTYTGLADLTKISVDNLKALEKNQFDRLPALPFLKGMVQNCAKVLDLAPEKAIAIFKRDYSRRLAPAAGITARPIDSAIWRRRLENPGFLLAAAAGIFIILIGWSWWQVSKPPQLIITAPVDGQTAVSPVSVSGRTDRGIGLSLNGIVVNLAADGSFATEFTASPGAYRLELKAVSRRGLTTEAKINVVIID